MIDIKLVRNQPDMIRELCRKRGSDVDVDELVGADKIVMENGGHLPADPLDPLDHFALGIEEDREGGEVFHAELKSEIRPVDEVLRHLAKSQRFRHSIRAVAGHQAEGRVVAVRGNPRDCREAGSR